MVDFEQNVPEMEYDEEASKLCQQDPKIIRFKEWLKNNGVIFDKIEYPAVYKNGVKGARLLEDVDSQEAFLFVPSQIQITT